MSNILEAAETLNAKVQSEAAKAIKVGQLAAFIMMPVTDGVKKDFAFFVKSKKVNKSDGQNAIHTAMKERSFKVDQSGYALGTIDVKMQAPKPGAKGPPTYELLFDFTRVKPGRDAQALSTQKLKTLDFREKVLFPLFKGMYQVSKAKAIPKKPSFRVGDKKVLRVNVLAKEAAVEEAATLVDRVKKATGSGIDKAKALKGVNAQLAAMVANFRPIRVGLKNSGEPELIALSVVLQKQLDTYVANVGRALRSKKVADVKKAHAQLDAWLNTAQGGALNQVMELDGLSKRLEILVEAFGGH